MLHLIRLNESIFQRVRRITPVTNGDIHGCHRLHAGKTENLVDTVTGEPRRINNVGGFGADQGKVIAQCRMPAYRAVIEGSLKPQLDEDKNDCE